MTTKSATIATALAVPTAAYAAGVRLRNAWYDRPGRSYRARLPVLSVGNLAVGGTGKTPLVAWLANRLLADGLVPAIVSRGYGGNAGPGPLVVSTGDGPRVGAGTCGDEPHLLARSIMGAIVVVGSDRIEGARCAASAGASVVVLDDGFQHRRLARDLDIVTLDGRAPFAEGRLLPRGNLREPPQSLRRADLVVLTRLREGEPTTAALHAIRATGYSGPIVRSGHRTTAFRDAAGAVCHAPERALAFCGIGDPQLFRADLEASGVVPLRFHAFRDHQPYTLARWTQLLAEASLLGVPLITTDKDLSRLQTVAGAGLDGAPLIVSCIEAVVWDEPPLIAALSRALATPRGSEIR